MSDRRDIIAIIPARGGSKGIPGKNVTLLHGLPLVAHSILAAKAVPEITTVYVSTDDERIAAVSRAHGAEVIERPADIAGDTASSESALLHALDALASAGRPEPDAVVFLQATSPLRQQGEVARALSTFWRENADSLFSATAAHGFMWRVESSGPRPLNYDPTARPRRQDAPTDVIENGSIYIFKPSVLRAYNSRLGGKIAVHVMRPQESFQIDDPWDLDLMSWLFTREAATRSPVHEAVRGRHYFTRREPTAAIDYEAPYWGVVTDPDGKVRDRTKERGLFLADVHAELAYINALPPGRLLDIGCGLGFLLSGVSPAWNKHGVEISKLAGESARAFGTIHVGDLHSAKYADDHFDVVVLHHVIEHLDDPATLLAEALRVLRPGGKFLLGTPDFDCAMARRFGQRFRLLHDPTHVSLFTNESMYRFLRDHGLEVDRVDYPYFETRHFTEENLRRVFDTEQTSPPFYGNVMTFYCTKPYQAAARADLLDLRRVAEVLTSTADNEIAAARAIVSECRGQGRSVFVHACDGVTAPGALGRIVRSGTELSDAGKPGDVFVLAATSVDDAHRNSIAAARRVGMHVISLTGAADEPIRGLSDVCVRIPTTNAHHIQALHIAVLHVLSAANDHRTMES